MIWLAAPFLLLVAIVIPIFALRASQAEPVPREQWPPPRTIYLQIIVNQSILAGAAWLAAFGANLETTWLGEANAAAIALGAGFAVLLLSYSIAGERSGGAEPDMAEFLHPKSRSDWFLWMAALVAAAVFEEYIYREVLFRIGERWLGMEAAVAISAALFGIAHRPQGWIGVIASAACGAVMHGIVLLSGGLAIAIAVHFLYDSSAVLLARFLRRPPVSDSE